ncbi:hypothetical protein QYE76_046271 [Lolium multiflorum]|uniref:Uncharacterized protein n=1 Tax=Lolium multiflorum TaxID=4521 RepID=A0AAD8TP81_LOLMU|nr:hypothetical protein QYE76_046271 [Lolium multiflorum]
MKRFIVELGVVPSALDPLVIYCDNMGAIANAQEPRSHKRLKHIKLRYHSIREYIEDGEVKICKVHTDLNVADPLTKALPRAKHDQHQNAMGVRKFFVFYATLSYKTNVLAEAPVVEQTRVTRSAAKAACAAKAPCQTDKVPVVNFSDNMSDGESYHSGNDSDYVDEAVAARFVIQSRRHVDGGEHADTVLSECAAVPSQTTLPGVATVVPGVSPELVSSSVPMDIDGAVVEPSDADALVRFMETDITVASADNRIVFQGLENLAETAAMHIDGVVDERDLDIGKQVLSETNEADLLRAKDASADGAVISVGTKSGEVLSSSLEVAVMNEDNGKGLSDGYDVVSETINDVVNDLKRSSSALDASEAKRSCVVREDRSVNPVQNEPSSAPKKKPNVRGRRQAVSKSQVATRSSPRRPPRGTSSGVADNVAVKSKVYTLKDRLEGSTKIQAAGTSTVVETGSQISAEVVSDGVVFKDAVFSSKSTSETVPTGKESAHEDPVEVSFATGSQISAVGGSDVVVPSKSTSEIVPTGKESAHEEPLEVSFATGQESAHEEPVEVSFAPQDSGTSVTNQMADPVGDVDHHASASTGTTVVVARDAEQNATTSPQDQIVTVVKRAKFVAADGKLSLTPAIPIDLSAYHVSVVNTSASDKSASPSEALGNADGHDSTISADVVKESETANVSSIPPTG